MSNTTRTSKKITTHSEEPSGRDARLSIPPESRQATVAEAAYFLAERRGFAPGYEQEDWLAAEALIRRQLEEE
jgi:hypothetical protein